MFEAIDELEKYFKDKNQFIKARKFIDSFFEIIENDKSYKKHILDKLRVD